MINETCPLVLHDLYSYDIVSAYPTILSKQFYDFKDVDLDNKSERSIFLGKQQKGNQGLSQFLMNSADNLVKFYLQENNMQENEIISTQRDGFIVTRLLDNDDEFINMKLREFIDFMVISLDRRKTLYIEGGDVVIKGMPYYYDGLQKFYKLFANLNFYDKSNLFSQLNHIKETVLTCQEVMPYLIPQDENSYIVTTYKGNLEIKDPDYVDPKTIDRVKYFNHFIKQFLSAIYLECYN
jgi:hypothetical protein